MAGKNKVIENSVLYTFSALLVKAVSFLLLPIYTRFLTPEDYGITNLAFGFIEVATYIVAFSLYSAVVRFYSDYRDDSEKLRRFYGTAVTFLSLSSVVFLVLGIIFNKVIISWFFEGIAFYPVVLIILLTMTFFSLHVMHQSILQGLQNGRKLTIINLTVFGFQVSLNLLLVVFFSLGAVGVLLSSLIINVGYSVFMVYDLRKSRLITFCIDRALLKEALAYSVPIMPHNLSTVIASFASRVFINNSGSLSAVGLYGVATQFAMLIDTVQSAVNQAFAPWFYEMMKSEDEVSRVDVVSLSRFLLIAYSLLYMCIGLFSQEMIIIMASKKYVMAWTTIPILVVAFSVKSIYYFYVNILFYYKDASRKIFIATILGSFADIMIAFELVPRYGMYGAAVSFLIAKIAVVTIVVFMSRKYRNIGYRIPDMLRTLIPSLLFMGAGLYFSYTRYLTEFNWMNLLYKMAVLAAYLLFVYLINREMIDSILKSGKLQQILRKRGAS